jgi:hypothetical protein
MAFASAGGYTSLPNGKFSPTIFSARALKSFRKTSVVEDVTNTDYFGELANFGDTVKIILEPDVTVTAYTRGTSPATQNLTDNDFSLTVDKANYFQFAIDDVEAKQSHVNWEELASNRAAYKIKDTFDLDVFTTLAAGADGGSLNLNTTNYLGSTWSGAVGSRTETVAAVKVAHGVTPTATAFSPLGLFLRAKRIMDLKNVPSDQRYAVVDPVFLEQLGNENAKLLDMAVMGGSTSPLYNGKVTDKPIRGFKLYESNNLPTNGSGPDATAGGATNWGTIIFGHMSAAATVSQIAKCETFRSQTRFADVVRGLHMYGKGIIRPEALVVVRYAIG